MARPATAQDFEGGPLYTRYARSPAFPARATAIRARLPAAASVLVVGCGYGYLVEDLLGRGVNAWGIDVAPYAVGKAQSELSPQARPRILQGDCLVRANLTAARAAAGLSGAQRFALAVTEDLLPVLTDAEVATALAEIRRVATAVLHVITPMRPGDQIVADPARSAGTYAGPPPAPTFRLQGLNWKTLAQWKALVGADPIYDAEMGTLS